MKHEELEKCPLEMSSQESTVIKQPDKPLFPNITGSLKVHLLFPCLPHARPVRSSHHGCYDATSDNRRVERSQHGNICLITVHSTDRVSHTHPNLMDCVINSDYRFLLCLFWVAQNERLNLGPQCFPTGKHLPRLVKLSEHDISVLHGINFNAS